MYTNDHDHKVFLLEKKRQFFSVLSESSAFSSPDIYSNLSKLLTVRMNQLLENAPKLPTGILCTLNFSLYIVTSESDSIQLCPQPELKPRYHVRQNFKIQVPTGNRTDCLEQQSNRLEIHADIFYLQPFCFLISQTFCEERKKIKINCTGHTGICPCLCLNTCKQITVFLT